MSALALATPCPRSWGQPCLYLYSLPAGRCILPVVGHTSFQLNFSAYSLSMISNNVISLQGTTSVWFEHSLSQTQYSHSLKTANSRAEQGMTRTATKPGRKKRALEATPWQELSSETATKPLVKKRKEERKEKTCKCIAFVTEVNCFSATIQWTI